MTTPINALIDSAHLVSPELEEPHYQLSEDDNYFTNDNLYKGKIGEKVTVSAVQISYKTKDGFKVKHNPFGSEYQYACSSGIDIKVTQGCKDYAEIEVKNLSPQPKPYGTDFVREKILPRFAHSGGGLKLLVITFLCLLTNLAVKLLEQQGIVIIEVGEKLTNEFYRNLKKLYTLGNRIHKAITNFWKQKVQPKTSQPLFSTNQLQLDSINTSISTVDNVNNEVTKQHDTPTLSYSQYVKEFEVEMFVTKKRETERLRLLYGLNG